MLILLIYEGGGQNLTKPAYMIRARSLVIAVVVVLLLLAVV